MPLTYTEQRTPKGRLYLRTVTSGNVTAGDAGLLTQVIAPGQKYQGTAILSVVEPNTDMSAEARKAFTSIGSLGEGESQLPVAVVVSSPPMRVLLSFVVRIAGSSATTKFFSTESEARGWLEGAVDAK